MSDLSDDVVVLLHGLAETPLTMAPLEMALMREGYRVHNLAYPSTSAPIAELADGFSGAVGCLQSRDFSFRFEMRARRPFTGQSLLGRPLRRQFESAG